MIEEIPYWPPIVVAVDSVEEKFTGKEEENMKKQQEKRGRTCLRKYHIGHQSWSL